MRIIIFIILFFSLQSQGQIIRANPNYRPFAVGSSCSYLLDQYSGAAAAYSLRKLDCDYAGSAIRVRRSNDNAEQDIGFTANGDLDTATLKTFVGANSGYVTTWYDQAGSNNATQTTAGNQPSIVSTGVLIRENDKPSIKFNTTNNFIHTISNISGAYSFYSVLSVLNQSGYKGIFSTGNSVLNGFMVLSSSSSANWGTYADGFGNYPANSNIKDAGIKLIELIGTINNSGTFYLNTTSDGTYINSSGQSIKHIGGNYIITQGLSGNISEILLWNSTPSQSGIESNINTYYSIY